ncbi:TRAP transporter permease DctM/Q [Candidatus Bathyarchaeota archaeon]|nr:MAG: TRAP transporter permease DctM/Q [Candidatus Bathyarchaeota archaeon]
MEISAGLVTGLIFGFLALGLLAGLPLSFVLGGIGVLFAALLWGIDSLYMIAQTAFTTQMSYTLICLPMFIFIGMVLEKAGIAEAMFDTARRWLGWLPGGLAVAVIVVCIVFGAMVGSSSAATVTMGLIALPRMLRLGYDKRLALGCINGGGPLAMLIPPSITAIIFASVAEVSIGKLFLGGLFPGLLLGFMFIVYIILRSIIQPGIGPAVPKNERGSWREKFIALRGMILPSLLIFGIMGTILLGIATPTEASAVGAFLSLVVAGLNRRLNWALVKESALLTLRLSSMIWWIIYGAHCYTSVYIGVGGKKLVTDILLGLPLSPLGILALMQFTFFVLGCFLDPAGIIMICAPVFLPVAERLGFDIVWYGVLFIVNMEMGMLTPPFGFNLFYLRSVTPPDISMLDIYRSITPFVIMQAICLVICILFPEIITWLPSAMIRAH